MSFNNPFPLLGVHPSSRLDVLAGHDIDRTRADYHHRVHMVGDCPVAFVDALTGKVDEETDHALPPTATVAEHIEAASYKIEQFVSDKEKEDLSETGYYIGACLVGVTVSDAFAVNGIVNKEVARLAIFKPTQHRIL